MECLDPNQASELVDGVLDHEQTAAIEAHVAECAECRGMLAALVSASDVPNGSIASSARPEKQTSPSAFLSAGSTIGRFVIEEPIGRGGMGVVYRARDPELDRAVAVKLLRFDYEGARAEEARARLLREARAMAKLNHPNVVTVHEAGAHHGHVFIAMELLAGHTLQQWVKAEPRDPEQIAEVLAGAGRGLAAAHAAGLVHRDFKPANVIVDAAGLAVVLDFGLVSGEGEAIAVAPPDDSDPEIVGSSSLTRTGVQLGTPAYMAPEQHLGDSVGPKADQFAFGICLYQALSGSHPFAADTVAEARARVLAGNAPPLAGKIPLRIRRAVARALEIDPRDRWPTMSALVRELERPRPRAWRWLTAGAIAVTIASVAFAASRRDRDVCTGAEQRLAGIWDADTRTAIRDGFSALDLPFASATVARVETIVDGYLGRWTSLHRGTCEANQRGELTEAAMTLQMTCLDRRLRETAAVIQLFRAPDPGIAANAESAARELTDLESCVDQSGLAAITPEPADPAQRVRLDALRESFARVKALIDLGRFVEAVAQAREDRRIADELGHAPATAEAAYWLGRAFEAFGDYTSATEALGEGVYSALGAGDDRRIVLAAIALVRVVGYRRDDVETGQLWHRIGRAALVRLGGDSALSRALDAARAALLATEGKGDEAEVIQRAVVASLERELGPTDVRVADALYALGEYCGEQYKFDCSREHYTRSLEILKRHHGEDHPSIARGLTALGTTATATGKLDEALDYQRRAVALLEASLGASHPDVGRGYHNLSTPLILTGRRDEALAASQKALAITTASLGANHVRNAAIHYTRGYILWSQERFDDAAAAHQRALELRTRAFGADHAYVGDIHVELGRVRRDQKRYRDAETHYARSLAIRRAKLGENNPKTVYSMTDLGVVQYLGGAPEKALPVLQLAEEHWDSHDGGFPPMVAENSFFLARAIWDSGGNRARARELGKKALDAYVKIGDQAAIARVREWVRRH